jgi:UDP-glucose 4-epimerase
MSRILVTGGAGFIGSHTCVELLENGYDTFVLDDFRNSERSVIDRIHEITGKKLTLFEADMTDSEAVMRIFQREKFDAVIHFAGLKAVGESVEKPLEYYENNLTGTLVVLRAMRYAGVKRIVFSSSATVYGPGNVVPYREGMPTSATNPYGWTKVMIEQILIDLCKAEPSMSAVLLRYFNPIGAHSSGLIGEDPSGIPNNLVPYIARVACGKLPELSVYGNDYETADGTGVRDYIHVVDLARAHIAALQYSMSHTGAEEINIGTGKGTSVLAVIHAYEAACGKKIPFCIAGRRAGDIAECYADTTKAEQLLGWRAEKTIEQMCQDSWHFTSIQLQKEVESRDN